MFNLEEWKNNNKDTIFRYLVLKKVWTPYEMENKFIEQSIYEDSGYYSFGIIEEVIDVKTDILLGIRTIINEDEKIYKTPIVKYYKLSDIILSKNDNEQNKQYMTEEEYNNY